MEQLSNKTIIVTGASIGIGAEIAKTLAKHGANVVINYNTNQEKATLVENEIKVAGGKAICVQADVTKEAEVAELFKQAKNTFGNIDTVVNNAGVYLFEPLEMVTEQEFDRQFKSNVWSVILTSKEAVKYFVNGGNIINISSIATKKATPMTMLYTATKSAVDGITRTLSKELGSKNIRVNSVLPGPTITEGNPIENTDMEKFIAGETPLGRVAYPKDIASLVLFLASDQSKWITGQKIGVSGGFD